MWDKDSLRGNWGLRVFLHLLARIFRVVVLLRGILFESGIFKATPLGRKTISVGNITVGGTGKTPFVILLARLLSRGGRSVVVLSRGYAARRGEMADEEKVLRELLPEVPVVVNADRRRAARDFLGKADGDVFLLDDGFQHRQARRDLDIVLLDATCPFGNGNLLPRGILREPCEALGRAGLIVLTHSNETSAEQIAWLRGECERLAPQAPVIQAAHVAIGVSSLDQLERRWPLEMLRGPVGACSAIGSPRGFFQTLEDCGAEIVVERIFADHHDLTAEEVGELCQACRERGVRKLVVTHKDAVKMRRHLGLFGEIEVLVLHVEMRILYGETELVSSLDRLFAA
ncbi:MAG: tetraacyldisaccharide 4'-kinase [Elusimicrobia bacterium]|nr:tetraacyldisaccharide 4'-kinase [Elusimicrobiota bacterium]